MIYYMRLQRYSRCKRLSFIGLVYPLFPAIVDVICAWPLRRFPFFLPPPSPSISLSVNRDKNSFLPRRGSEDDGGLSHILDRAN